MRCFNVRGVVVCRMWNDGFCMRDADLAKISVSQHGSSLVEEVQFVMGCRGKPISAMTLRRLWAMPPWCAKDALRLYPA